MAVQRWRSGTAVVRQPRMGHLWNAAGAAALWTGGASVTLAAAPAMPAAPAAVAPAPLPQTAAAAHLRRQRVLRSLAQ